MYILLNINALYVTYMYIVGYTYRLVELLGVTWGAIAAQPSLKAWISNFKVVATHIAKITITSEGYIVSSRRK